MLGSCATHGLPLHPSAGLLRVISWTLNGLDVCTQNAVVRTSEDGQAHNTFWLTKRGTGGCLAGRVDARHVGYVGLSAGRQG